MNITGLKAARNIPGSPFIVVIASGARNEGYLEQVQHCADTRNRGMRSAKIAMNHPRSELPHRLPTQSSIDRGCGLAMLRLTDSEPR